jgi:hypothetical protein
MLFYSFLESKIFVSVWIWILKILINKIKFYFFKLSINSTPRFILNIRRILYKTEH